MRRKQLNLFDQDQDLGRKDISMDIKTASQNPDTEINPLPPVETKAHTLPLSTIKRAERLRVLSSKLKFKRQ
jgi:hypothetical protein